jgi:molecular chaperone HscC
VFVPQTGERRQLVIMDNEAPMDEKALNARREELAKLKVHPRDQEANRAVVARATRCYEESLGERREYLGQCLSQFLATIDGQDPRAIDAARDEFTSVLDRFEGETYL